MRIKVTIRGRTPLLCNRFTDAAAIQATEGTRSASSAGDRGTPREIAESKLYLDNQGRPCIPQPNILRCIVDGGQFHKIGKNKATTQKTSLVYSYLDIEDTMLPIRHQQPWSVDMRAVVNPSTHGRILCYRPRFDDWEIDFVIDLKEENMGVKLARSIVDDGGLKIGLGDFRPARKGPFGRFEVIHWQELVVKLAEAAE
jgi:hypothetical protein